MENNISFYTKIRRSPILISCYSFLTLSIVLLLLPGKQNLYVDEHVHHAQIVSLINGTFKMSEQPSMLPGYHGLIAIIAYIFGKVDIIFFRFISIFIASIAIGCFSKLYTEVNTVRDEQEKTLFAFFPITTPFFFLIYTDVLSLLLFIAALYTGLKKNYQLSAFFGILNLVVRQNTFFWYVFSFLLVFVSHYPGLTIKNCMDYVKKSWLFIVGVIVFIAFVFINKGVAIGEKNMHPGVGINLGNIFFFLFLVGFLVFPIIARTIRKPTRIHVLLIVSMFVLYWFGFEVTHPYNLFNTNYFLRNDVLRYASSNIFARLIFFAPIVAGMFVFIQFYETNKKVFFLYFVFGTLSLIPSWLIEQRYYFIHFMLLFLYCLKDIRNLKTVTFSYAILSLFLLYGIFTNSFFI